MKRLHKNFCLIGLILLILTGCEREPIRDITNLTYGFDGCSIAISYKDPAKLGDTVTFRASSDNANCSSVCILFDEDTIADVPTNQFPWSGNYVLDNTTIGEHNLSVHFVSSRITTIMSNPLIIVE